MLLILSLVLTINIIVNIVIIIAIIIIILLINITIIIIINVIINISITKNAKHLYSIFAANRSFTSTSQYQKPRLLSVASVQLCKKCNAWFKIAIYR